METKGIIFDLDGVLCHTDEYHYLAWKQIADQLGLPFDRTINHRLRGVSRAESLEILLEPSPTPLPAAEKEALAARKNELYRAMLYQLTPAQVPAAVTDTLRTLRRRGYSLAIGSSSKNAPLILARLCLASYFDTVVDGNQITRSKPDPEVFLKAAQLLRLPPEACAVVEDADAGIEAALAAGMQAVLYGDAATGAGAHHKAAHFAHLLSLFPQT